MGSSPHASSASSSTADVSRRSTECASIATWIQSAKPYHSVLRLLKKHSLNFDIYQLQGGICVSGLEFRIHFWLNNTEKHIFFSTSKETKTWCKKIPRNKHPKFERKFLQKKEI